MLNDGIMLDKKDDIHKEAPAVIEQLYSTCWRNQNLGSPFPICLHAG